ncbi:MAG: DUF1343 domain-containing protein [Clostridium sp.]|nr:DUF1343 domain-containing protein [Bacteroides sp.]MCM1197809.1 DUF1343 domain-containing protein [Clostridium sp.]
MKRIISAILLLCFALSSANASADRKRRRPREKAVTDTVLVHDTIYIQYGVYEDTDTVECGQAVNEESPLCMEPVKPGIEVLRDMGFAPLAGKRVGLVTNPSGVDRNMRSTIDILFNAPEVNLVALFGPEHGVRGDIYAGGKVTDMVDSSTGLPVFSLYGSTRKPTHKMLEGIDVMVYDIQDVGARSYTFISTLGLVMEACAELDIEVMVLDRPNPLGGNKIEGCYAEDGLISFVGQYKIPYIYGLTVGELARMVNEEGMNCGQLGRQEASRCRLSVVPMEGWHRDMLYRDTRLPWVLPSPNIPTADAAINYSAAGICGELYNFLNIGIGYTLPFGVFGAEWIDAEALKRELDSYGLPGIGFRTIYFKPFSGSCAGKLVKGVQYFFTDYEAASVTMTQFYVMQAVVKLYPKRKPFEVATGIGLFDKVCGTAFIRSGFSRRYQVEDILGYWNKDADAFRELSRRYYLYE